MTVRGVGQLSDFYPVIYNLPIGEVSALDCLQSTLEAASRTLGAGLTLSRGENQIARLAGNSSNTELICTFTRAAQYAKGQSLHVQACFVSHDRPA
jgi:hypothetical protein